MKAMGLPEFAPDAARATDGLESEKRPQCDVRALLERLAELHENVAETLRELSELQLDDSPDPRLSVVVNAQANPDQPGHQDRPYLSVRNVADRLGVDIRTIRRWREVGSMPPAFANGSVVRWRADLIDEWIAAQEESP